MLSDVLGQCCSDFSALELPGVLMKMQILVEKVGTEPNSVSFQRSE